MNRESTAQPTPAGVVYTDADIKREIIERLRQAVELDSAKVTVEVQSGLVKLGGTVPDALTRHTVEELAECCPGVQDVENGISVEPS